IIERLGPLISEQAMKSTGSTSSTGRGCAADAREVRPRGLNTTERTGRPGRRSGQKGEHAMRNLIRSTTRGRVWAASLAATMLLAVSLTAASAGVDAPPPGKSPTLDRIREQKVLRAGIGISLPWLGQNPKTSQYFGPAIELGDRIAKNLAVQLELLPSTWDVIIAGLQANKTDLLLAPLFATEKRRQVVDFVNWTEA